MWARMTMWDRTIELGAFDHWVITGRPPWAIKHWLDDGMVQVPEERIWQSIRAAMSEVEERDVPSLWRQLFDHAGPPPDSVDALASELVWEACGPIPRLIVLERLIERGFRFEPLVWDFRPPPPRTQTDHYIVVEAIDAEERPVEGLHLELLIADGEVKSARTDRDGIARVERIQAGRVVIRVLGLDGAAWRALDGEAAQPSGTSEGVRWYVVKQGECLSRIAHQHGFSTWKELWAHPKNEPLRRKRKNPHVLHPGDEIAIGSPEVYEIVRPTDATHRIVVSKPRLELKVVLGDHHGRPFTRQAYELRLSGDANEPPLCGTTDGQGQLHAQLPAGTSQVLVSLPAQGISWPLAISAVPGLPDSAQAGLGGAASPSEETVRALQTRLNALGIPSGAVNGVWGEQTRLALLQLRRARGSAEQTALCDEDLSALERFGV